MVILHSLQVKLLQIHRIQKPLNMAQLPEEVGINLLANGEYEYLVSRGLAVMAPLAVTGVCILMMWMSRRTIYPWIISIFSLVLPLLIWVTNVFPA